MTTERLKHVCGVVDVRAGNRQLPLLAVSIHLGVVPRNELTDDEPRADDLSAYRVCAPGDIVLNRMRAFQGAIGMASQYGIVSPDYLVLRPRPGVYDKYLHYTFRSSAFVGEMIARLRGIGSTDTGSVRTPRINAEDLLDIQVDLPSAREQRAIADYLDRETARIDALIAAKHRMLGVLLEQEQRLLLNAIGDWRSAETWTLRQAGTQVVTGPFGTQLSANEYVTGGVPVINPTHINRTGVIEPDLDVTLPSHIADRLARHRLRHGDMVLGRKGDVGRSAVVTAAQAGWVCGSDAIAVRTSTNRLRSDFLSVVLHLDLYRQQLEAVSTGAMVANVNESTLLGFRLPRVDVRAQREVVDYVSRTTHRSRAARASLAVSVELLQERRQALITGATTGRPAVPAAA